MTDGELVADDLLSETEGLMTALTEKKPATAEARSVRPAASSVACAVRRPSSVSNTVVPLRVFSSTPRICDLK